MMYSAYKLNKQGDNIQPWHVPFQSTVPCLVLTAAFWPTYRFLSRQVRWSVIPILWRIFQFVVIHAVKGFGVVHKAEVFFWNSLAFSMIQQMLEIWSLFLLLFLNPTWTSGSSWFTYCWSLAWKILSITLLVCESAALSMPANLDNSAMTTGLEKISFHPNPKERQCQRMLKLPHNCTHLTC